MIDRLLRDLESRGVELWFEGDRLRFRAPKGALTAELRSQLSAARAEVVAHLRAAAEARASSAPLSYSQRALWFLFQRAPLGAAYNVAFTARVVSPLDDRALLQSLQALIDRHASLRTTYALVEGVPTQRVAGVGTAELRVYDVPGIDEAALHQRVVADYRQPFDLEKGPLLRTSVYRRAADDQVLLLAMHHIAVDGWSLLQLVDEMQALYHEAVGGPTASLPRPEIEYTEFVAREAKKLAGPDGARLTSYWQGALGEPRAWLELPSDRPREKRKAVPGAATLSFDIDANLSGRLRQLARDEGVTPFVVLLAAWKTLLFRCTGTEDVIVGTPTFGRNLPEVARVIGNFVNSIPLRSRLASDLPFRTLLAQLRQTVLEGLDAQEFPLGLMVERLQSTRDVTRSPLFGTLFVLQRFDQLRALEPVLLPGHAEAVTLGALRLRHYALDQQEGQFDLTIQLIDKAGALAGQLKYDTDLYDAATVMRLAEHYQVILGAVAADPGRALGELPLLAPDEREAMIRAAGVPQPTSPATALHARFEAQVLRAPNAIALTCGDERLTYGQLNQRANRLAHRLRAAGVGPETLVGLCTERGIDMVVALLGILKAGGAYLPVDLSYPAERVAFMLADAEAPVLVTERKLAGTLPAHAGTVVLVDDDLSEWPDTNPDSGAGPDSLAYVIYTSGSTGRPKGTMITHRAVGRLFDSTEPWYHFGPNDSWTLFHSIAFDFSVWEVWGALLYGGKLVVVPYWASRSPEAFLELIIRERITVLNQTPSAFRQLIQADLAHGAPASALRLVVFGGEALELQSLRPWFERHGDARPSLVNMYGITETCVHVTYRPISLRDLEAGAGSVIGVPIPDLRVHVLDAGHNPAPYGVIGEMFVGGPGLARGYLKRPDLTESRFVPDPFVPGERLYRTGDLARRLASGELEYLGRSDQQVKIRGFRIELGEIEAALARQPLVQDAAVIVREDAPGDRRLVAYVVAKETPAGFTDELRTALRTILPDYMVPAAFVFLDHLPLTSNGKLDRNALPRPEATRSATVSYVAPRSREEEILAKIWTETLGIAQVGVHDNFFGLGGDSILSLQVIARARQHGLLLTPRQLFEQQTVASLAAVATPVEGSAGAAAFQDREAGPIPLTPIQRWFVELGHPEPHHYNQSVLLEVPADYRTDVLRAAVQRVVEHHDALRLRFGPPGGWRQVVADAETHDVVEHVDLAHTDPATQPAAVEARCSALQASLDLEHGPLIRVAHFTRGAGVSGRLFIVVHHLAVDGVSWRIILGDIEAAYADALRGKPAALPPVATSFAQWARLLDRHADSAELRGEAAYWTRVAGTPVPRLPAAHAPDRSTFSSTRHVIVALDAGETRSLLQDVPGAYGTQINDALLTALARALAGVVGGSRVLLDLEGHGRVDLFRDVDLTRTVGWFTTLFPVSLELPPDAGVGASLQAVKDQLRAIPGSGLGFGVLKFLCRDSAVVEPLRSAPVPEVCFNYLGQLDQLAAGSFRFVEEGSGADRAPSGKRSHLLEVNAIVREGRLSVTWSYGDGTLDEATVEALAGAFLTQLRGLIAHCVSAEAAGYTPSDFALAGLDQATLDRLVATVNADGERSALPRRSIEDVYPLTPMQQGILFHTLLSPESGVYFQQLSWTLHAPFNPDAFERAWRRLVERHAVLRTSFAWEDLDQPLQIVHAQVTLPVEHLDWRNIARVDQDERFEAFLRADRKRGLTLGKPPLLRLALIRTGDDVYRFVSSFHHLSFDGWSLAVLLQELFTSYSALLGHKSPLLGPVRPYRDYLAWLASQDSLKAQRYWKHALRGVRAPTLLGSERQQPGAQGNAVYEVQLPPALATSIQQFAHAQHLTTNTLVQGTWALLLSLRSGENDVLFGTTVAGRPAEIRGIESMVGLFINTLPLRVTIDPGVTLAAWLHGLQAHGAEMRQYEYSSLMHIQTWSDVPQGTPLFQSILVFENYPVDESLRAAGPLSLSEPRVEEYTNYPMTVFAKPGPHFSVAFSYDTSVFDDAAVREIGSGFLTLLEEIVADGDKLVRDLVLPHASGAPTELESERRLAPAPELPVVPTTVHARFEEQAARSPDAIAAICADSTLTYAELNRRANRLAHRLRALGVGPGTLVGLGVERSLDLPVGLLGILKAGGAYVPVDLSYPPDRVAFVLADAGAPAVVTTRAQAPALKGHAAAPVCLDDDPGDWPDTNPEWRATPDDLAYVIYTSGSTGRPKGVEVEHRNVVNFLEAMRQAPGFSADDVLLAVTTIAFDIAGLELWLPLTTGGRVVLASRADALDGERLVALIKTHGVTILQATPATWRLLLEAGWRGAPNLHALCGGEALPRDLVASLLPKVGELWNMYGPTETTIWSTIVRITDASAPITIGRAIANTRAYVFDESGAPAAVGTTGELCIGGAGVARGYHHRPELTAERFVSITLPGGRAERVYRTGDLVRLRGDGRLDYLGRRDEQIKLRGYRIELGEIESVLAGAPGVRQCVVTLREDRQGDRRLVAYVVADAGASFEAAALRRALRVQLPDYMIPAHFVQLDALPLTPNGKIDRKALPEPSTGRQAAAQFVAPRAGTEQRLAKIWEESLRVEGIGAHDSFFELGGNSLRAINVAFRIRKALGVKLSLVDFLREPTIAAVASVIEKDGASRTERLDAEREIPNPFEARPDERFEPFPLTDVQEAYWIGRGAGFEMGNVATHAYAEVEIEGLDIDRYERAWRRLIDRHDMLRAIIRTDGQQQVLSHTPPFVIARHDLRGRSPAAAEAALTATREDLSHQLLPSDRWPLFEVHASRLTEGRYRIHLSIDLLIGDAWSFTILQRDFDRLYADPENDLEPLEMSFRDYVLAMVKFRETDDYQRSLAYWDARSPSLPARPDLPLAKDPSSIEHPRFVRRHASLDREEWSALQRKAEVLGLTPNGVILAAYADVLGTWSRRAHFLLNLTLFNRVPVHPQVEELVGDFTSITLLDVELRPDESFAAMAKRLLGRLWEDLDHRFVSGVQVLRRLVREQSDRATGAAPVVLTSTIGFERASAERSDLARRTELTYAISQTSQVWLDQMVGVEDGRLVFNWDVVEELFPQGMIDAMFESYVAHVRRLATSDAAWQETRAQRASRLVPPEQLRLRTVINATGKPVRDTLLHVLFEEQAAARPDQTAIVSADVRLTYAQVVQLSRRLGATLREGGAKPNSLVAIVMEKGWEQVVAALAILQSGAAYVPIDANLPEERRLQLIDNTGAAFVLTQPALADALVWPATVRVLRVERPTSTIADVAPLTPVQNPDDLAYVIYTSGSTGLPKGVMIDHRGAVNTIVDLNARFAVGPGDRVLALSSLSFDLSVYDIFGFLAAGGTIVIPEAASTRDPARWAELVERESVTIWNSVPALMEMFVEYRSGRSQPLPPSLRLVMMSGDWIPITLPAQIRALSSTVQIMSLGGATEASIWSILYPIDQVDPAWKSIPYGRPMVNQTFHVLDDTFEPCPVWVPGQLYIGGIGVAKGYWHDAEKTHAKFIVHPRTGERLYSTGDLGRYLPSGDIEFLGREDFQVKIRGFRIELGEIEAAFRQHPSVKSVVVTAVGKTTAERRLLAYVVPQGGASATLDKDLSEFIAAKLPEHMCPARVMLIDNLPLTPNGKVDLRSLPVPDAADVASTAGHVAPRNDTEAALVAVWKEVLHAELIGVHDNFFELGGDSVTAIQVVSRMVREGYELSPVMMFRYPSIAELAGKLAPMAQSVNNIEEITI